MFDFDVSWLSGHAPYVAWALMSAAISGMLIFRQHSMATSLDHHVRLFREYDTNMRAVLDEHRAKHGAYEAKLAVHEKDIVSICKGANNAIDAVNLVPAALAELDQKIKAETEHRGRLALNLTAIHGRLADVEGELDEARKPAPAEEGEDAPDAGQQQIDSLKELVESLRLRVAELSEAIRHIEDNTTKAVAQAAYAAGKAAPIDRLAAEIAATDAASRELGNLVKSSLAQAIKRFENVEADIIETANGVNQIAERVDGCEADIAAALRSGKETAGRVADLDSYCADLRDRVAGIGDLKDLGERVAEMEETVDALDEDLDTLETAFEERTRTEQSDTVSALNSVKALALECRQMEARLLTHVKHVADQLGAAIDRLDAEMHPTTEQETAPAPNGVDMSPGAH